MTQAQRFQEQGDVEEALWRYDLIKRMMESNDESLLEMTLTLTDRKSRERMRALILEDCDTALAQLATQAEPAEPYARIYDYPSLVW